MELIIGVLLLVLVFGAEISLYHHHGLDGLRYRCQFSTDEVTEGDTLEFTETVENDKSLPVPWLKAELTTSKWLDFPENHCTVTDQTRFVTGFFSVRSHAKTRRVWHVQCEKRGIYQVEHVVLVTSDLLGAVRLSLGATDTGDTLTVLPQRYTKAGRLLPKLRLDQYGEAPVRFHLETDPCFPAGVRPYTSGDPYRRIHWKATAHTNTLLVRQEEPVALQVITVLLALQTNAPDEGMMTRDKALLEHTIQVCAECLWELCQGGWMVRLCIGENGENDRMIETPYGGGESTYRRMLEIMAGLTLDDAETVSHLLEFGKPGGHEATLLITPYTDDEIAQWKQKNNSYVLVTGHARDRGNCADAIVDKFNNE